MKRIVRLAMFLTWALSLFVSSANGQTKIFKASLAGGEEVPRVDSSATGLATFELSSDGNSLMYTLSVSNIEHVTMAHIHIGSPGEVGKPIATLYPTETNASMDEKKGEMADMALTAQKMNGVIAKGTIYARNLMGPLKGKTIAELVAQIHAGKAYVNVHTREHPDGEIRGTIQ
jgi:hypothetical protein